MGEQSSQQPIKFTIDASQITIENQNPKVLNESLKPSPNNITSILSNLHAGYFRICVSLGAQAVLWKTLSKQTHTSQAYHRIFPMLPSTAFLLLWWLAFGTLTIFSFLYILKCIFKFKMVKAMFSTHIGVDYLYLPWISWLLLLLSAPFAMPKTLSYQIMWWVFVAPVLALDVKVYGQWFMTEKRFLSISANPMSQLSVIGNLVGAWAAAKMGWKESAMCVFTVGAVHYLVIFITLYQRLPGAHSLPARMRPVFFLFVASPSMASLAWNSINGEFNTTCKMFFFLSIFLFTSLASRPTWFRKSMKEFNVAWWAYSFPLTFLALTSVEYAKQVKCAVADGLSLALSALAVLVFLSLLVFTAINTNTFFHDNDPSFRFNHDLATKEKTKDGCKITEGAKEVLPLSMNVV